jgi:hypothetical protein
MSLEGRHTRSGFRRVGFRNLEAHAMLFSRLLDYPQIVLLAQTRRTDSVVYSVWTEMQTERNRGDVKPVWVMGDSLCGKLPGMEYPATTEAQKRTVIDWIASGFESYGELVETDPARPLYIRIEALLYGEELGRILCGNVGDDEIDLLLYNAEGFPLRISDAQ